MARSKLEKSKGRMEGGSYFGIPHVVLESPNYTRLSSHAVKLLNDLGCQYGGSNNGDLCAAYTVMEKRGWRSSGTLHRAVLELKHYGLIELTRQGGRNKPNLYAFTWRAIDHCKGKLDVNETRTPTGLWKIKQPDHEKPTKKSKQ